MFHKIAYASNVVLISIATLLIPSCGGGGESTSTAAAVSTTTTTTTSPTISTQPTSQTASVGGSATFSVIATGSGTLTYQWYKASTVIGGATASTYSIATAATTDAGSYYVIVTNSSGSATSSAVTLTISATSTAACETTYVNSVLTAVTAFKAAIGTALTSATEYDIGTYSTAQLNVYKTKWSNLPPGALSFSRPGITLAQLTTSAQIAALNTLAKAALSTAGYADFQGVLAADDYLGYSLNANGYGAGLYHVAFVGTPSQTGQWTLMFGGHHMAFNINFNQACAYPTPHHIGVEPKSAFTSNSHTNYNFYSAGNYQVLSNKAAAVIGVFTSFSGTMLSSAFLTGQIYSDVYIGPVEASTGSYTNVATRFATVAASSNRGLLVSSLSAAQQALVTAAIQQYTNDYDATTAARLMADYQSGYSATYVAWANATGVYNSAGPNVDANATYLRIEGPRVWIETAVQNGIVVQSQTHYHMIYRDKTFDYFNELAS